MVWELLENEQTNNHPQIRDSLWKSRSPVENSSTLSEKKVTDYMHCKGWGTSLLYQCSMSRESLLNHDFSCSEKWESVTECITSPVVQDTTKDINFSLTPCGVLGFELDNSTGQWAARWTAAKVWKASKKENPNNDSTGRPTNEPLRLLICKSTQIGQGHLSASLTSPFTSWLIPSGHSEWH